MNNNSIFQFYYLEIVDSNSPILQKQIRRSKTTHNIHSHLDNELEILNYYKKYNNNLCVCFMCSPPILKEIKILPQYNQYISKHNCINHKFYFI